MEIKFCAIYARVSTGEQLKKKYTSLDSQIDIIKR